ncbi:Oidioi.mRNA.OKI2018_I69.chr2.g6671.t1.cds [Oikopleura dioica]|uniref:Oidioi.mRNA.OKI2018_I69.chr2.g6671.t1.cds n=1 Tax=Oikopleura dioica TaxID=34765 RepID=A0ABN7T7B3_OIKDI|nr:Oidioi.mRNA.OKI2018_I69.chr2.g6671.t1.cds [Oikopleura dioica]
MNCLLLVVVNILRSSAQLIYADNDKIVAESERALRKCFVYMEQVMDCNPPLRKIGKYKWRMEKNFKNALFHLQNENCRLQEDSSYAPPKRDPLCKPPKPQLSVKLGEICEGLSRDFFAKEIFSGCRRFNAWQDRNNHLLKDILRMRNQCLKRANLPY